mmetsp:Transcript_18169/g.20976  ORF Transcript_18169/g.20976 Transcript_18169/m.20976 type:complete len:333 (-) Transcript_18169:83-1081(-)
MKCLGPIRNFYFEGRSRLKTMNENVVLVQMRYIQSTNSLLLSKQAERETKFLVHQTKQKHSLFLPCRRSFASSSSVSNTEVTKFSNMSQDWWNQSKNPLLSMNPIRIQYIQQQLQTLTEDNGSGGKYALDVGCGAGILSESLRRRFHYNVIAIDPSYDLIRCGKERSCKKRNDGSIQYLNTTIEDLVKRHQHSNQLFDIICVLEVLEHVGNIPSMLQSASKLLNPNGGKIFVSTVNRTAISYALAIVGAEYVMQYLEPKTHDWSKFLSPFEVQQYMEQVGLEQIHITGMRLQGLPPPIGTSWNWTLSDTDLSINWIGTYQHMKRSERKIKEY